jgi:hypothetical protein
MRAKLVSLSVILVVILGLGFAPLAQGNVKADGGGIHLTKIGGFATSGQRSPRMIRRRSDCMSPARALVSPCWI